MQRKYCLIALRLVDFAIRLPNSVLNLPDGDVKYFGNSNYRRTVRSILLIKKFLGLIKITFGIVHALVESDICQTYVGAIFLLCWTMFYLCIAVDCLYFYYVACCTT